jgi:hypothetical protein
MIFLGNCWWYISKHKFWQLKKKTSLVDNKFLINSHKNQLKISSERMQQISRMLNANIMKIC